MNNPFELLESRLCNIESLILDLKHNSKEEIQENDEDTFLTVKQASDFLKISVATTYSKVSRRELPVMKRGKRLYFSKTELIGYLKQGKKLTHDEVENRASDYLLSKGK